MFVDELDFEFLADVEVSERVDAGLEYVAPGNYDVFLALLVAHVVVQKVFVADVS